MQVTSLRSSLSLSSLNLSNRPRTESISSFISSSLPSLCEKKKKSCQPYSTSTVIHPLLPSSSISLVDFHSYSLVTSMCLTKRQIVCYLLPQIRVLLEKWAAIIVLRICLRLKFFSIC